MYGCGCVCVYISSDGLVQTECVDVDSLLPLHCFVL